MRITYFGTLTAVLLTHMILPAVFLLWIWRDKSRCRLAWYLKISVTTPYFILIFFVGYWHQVSYYLRYAILIIYFTVLLRSYIKTRVLPLYRRFIYVDWIYWAFGAAISLVLLYNLVTVIESFNYKETPVNLSFPLKNGSYLVCFGGNAQYNPFANYHYKYPPFARAGRDVSVIYAMDIVKLNAYGKSGPGILSSNVKGYGIFGETVYSPCNGTIADIKDNSPDEHPFSYDYPYNPGNSITIRYEDVLILLGHLEKGSISVKPGDIVKQGQPLAKVGNSGWTAEPHLHIQATRSDSGSAVDGRGVPILFGGRFPVKNSLFSIAP